MRGRRVCARPAVVVAAGRKCVCGVWGGGLGGGGRERERGGERGGGEREGGKRREGKREREREREREFSMIESICPP